jgi:hypothetical protein
MNYKTKLTKYTQKTHQLGGLIGEIPLNRLDTLIKYDNLPDQIKNYINMITIPNTHIIPIGSATYKIQHNPSDIDINNIVDIPSSTNDLISSFISNIKKMVQNIISSKDVFFSDFKAGNLHWKPDQILSEKYNNLSLTDACNMKSIIKLDIIVPYNSRYVEMSAFFILKSNDGFINVDKDFFDNIQEQLFNDIQKYRNVKPFKSAKRLWSLSKIRHDVETLNKLEYLINSSVSILSQINADIETLQLLINKNINYDKNYILIEIDTFIDRITRIIDIDLNEDEIIKMIRDIKTSFINNDNNIISNLTKLHDYLLSIINKETLEYLDKIKFNFPDTFVKVDAHKKSVFNHDSLENVINNSNKLIRNLSESDLIKAASNPVPDPVPDPVSNSVPNPISNSVPEPVSNPESNSSSSNVLPLLAAVGSLVALIIFT